MGIDDLIWEIASECNFIGIIIGWHKIEVLFEWETISKMLI